jgi:hypothetical protein
MVICESKKSCLLTKTRSYVLRGSSFRESRGQLFCNSYIVYSADANMSRFEIEPRLAVGAATDIDSYVTITSEMGEMLVG